MDKQVSIQVLEELKCDLVYTIEKIGHHHNLDEYDISFTTLAIEDFISSLKLFYMCDTDKSFKKALVFSMIKMLKDHPLDLDFKQYFPLNYESSIELLLGTVLYLTAPEGWYDEFYLSFQEPICDNKYRIDIALMKRTKEYRKSDTNGIPIIGIECDGYDYHYSNPDTVSKTLERIRNIKMWEGIEVLQYTGKEIYNKPFEIANNFWSYVDKKFNVCNK